MKNKVKGKYGVWGQFGSGGQIADGQAVRTTIITKEMIDRYGRGNLNILNTNKWSKNPLLFFLKSILLVAKNEKVIIFPADNGFKVFVPILYIANLFFKRELYYVVIGGFLPGLLSNNMRYISILKKFKALFVQTTHLKEDLEELDLNNVYILSNLKNLEELDVREIKTSNETKVSVCTFSRVTRTKGIEDAISAVELVNQKIGQNLITLDVYGIIDKNYKQTFEELLVKHSDFVNYKGVIDYDKTVSVLKEYFVLLFPTFYHGEGLPGNVIDAFYSGLPIIATDWMYNSEVIKNYENGILVPVNNPEAISDALYLLYKDRELTNKLKHNNLKESRKYDPKIVLKEFFNLLD